jgi:hypothetical protein
MSSSMVDPAVNEEIFLKDCGLLDLEELPWAERSSSDSDVALGSHSGCEFESQASFAQAAPGQRPSCVQRFRTCLYNYVQYQSPGKGVSK